MKRLFLLAWLLPCVAFGASVPFTAFKPSQFEAQPTGGPGPYVALKDGAAVTNLWWPQETPLTFAYFDATNGLHSSGIPTNAIGGGITISGTPTFIQYLVDATTLGNSPWYVISSNRLGWVTTNYFLYASALNAPSATDNMGFGNLSLASLTSGSDNTIYGSKSGTNITSGGGNSGFGSRVLESLTTGLGNNAFGFSALNNVTTESDNNAFGYEALAATTTGYFNSAFGGQSLRDTSIGNNNSGFGYNTLLFQTTAVDNSAFGSQAGRLTTTGSRNTFLGSGSGTNNTTGNDQTLVGWKARPATAALTNIHGLGSDIVITNSNTTVIGNDATTLALIKSTGFDGTGTHFLSDDGTYKVAGTGDVVGPASSTDNAVARYNLTTGKLIQDSVVTIADTTGNITQGDASQASVTYTANLSGASDPVLTFSNTQVTLNTGTSFASGNNVTMTATGTLGFASRANIQSTGASDHIFYNSGFTGYGKLQLGGTTASFPAIGRSTDYVHIIDAAGGNTSGLMINSGTPLLGLLSATDTLDFGSIAAAGSADLTITVTGAAAGDTASMGLPAAPAAGIVFNAFVSAANTVTIRASNITAAPVDPASETYRVTVHKF